MTQRILPVGTRVRYVRRDGIHPWEYNWIPNFGSCGTITSHITASLGGQKSTDYLVKFDGEKTSRYMLKDHIKEIHPVQIVKKLVTVPFD